MKARITTFLTMAVAAANAVAVVDDVSTLSVVSGIATTSNGDETPPFIKESVSRDDVQAENTSLDWLSKGGKGGGGGSKSSSSGSSSYGSPGASPTYRSRSSSSTRSYPNKMNCTGVNYVLTGVPDQCECDIGRCDMDKCEKSCSCNGGDCKMGRCVSDCSCLGGG